MNFYPNDSNYLLPSFNPPVIPPDVDPDTGGLLIVAYNPAWQKVLMGALTQLLQFAAWQGTDDEKKLVTARALLLMTTLQANARQIDTPFWDEASDVDDQASEDSQMWYGTVTDAEAPPGELTFLQNAVVWTFTGLLAVSGTPAAAILFNTIAPKFILATEAGDLGEIIRIVIDGQEAARVDTTGHAGEIIETTIVGDPANTIHQLYIVKVS